MERPFRLHETTIPITWNGHSDYMERPFRLHGTAIPITWYHHFHQCHGTAISLVKNQHFVIPRKQHLMPFFVGPFHGTAIPIT